MPSKKKSKGKTLDWAEFCEEVSSGPRGGSSFGRSRGGGGGLPSGPSGLPTGPSGLPDSGYGGRGGDRDRDRGDRGERRGGDRDRGDPNAGRSDGPGGWRRGGGGGGGGGFGGGGGGFGRDRDDRGGDRDEDRGPSRADESTSWRSSRAAPARRAPPPSFRDRAPPSRDREPPRRSFNNDGPPRRDERPPARDRSPPGRGLFGSRNQGPPPRSFDGPRRDGPPPRRSMLSMDAQRGPPPRRERSPPRKSYDDEEFGSFRNRTGPPRRPTGLNRDPLPSGPGGARDGPRNMGGGGGGVAPMDRRGNDPVNFEVDAAGAFKKEQKQKERRAEAFAMGYDDFGDDDRPRRSGLKEGTTKIKAAPINAWGARGNPVTGPSRPAPRRRPAGNSAPIGRPEPARTPPQQGGFVQRMPQTRFAGTPQGFGYETVQRLMQNPPGRGGRPKPRASGRFARPEQRIAGGLPSGPRGGLPTGPSRGRSLPSGPGGLPSGPGGRPGPAGRAGPAPRSRPHQSPPAQNDQSAFPELPEAPKRKVTKVPVDTARLKREEAQRKKREEAAKRRAEKEAAERLALENLAKTKQFVVALGETDTLQPEVFRAGLTVLQENPNIDITKGKYGALCATLDIKCPSVPSNPDLPDDKVADLLAVCIGHTILKSSAEKPAVEPFAIASEVLEARPFVAALAEGAFKYILKRAKGDESRLVALTEGIDVMSLLNAPEDNDEWDDFLEDMGLICLAPEEDVADQVAQAIEDGDTPKQVLAILENTEAVPPSVAKQIATFLADRYNKEGATASEFCDDSVTALFRKAAGSNERTQITAVTAVVDRWAANGKRKSALVLIIKQFYENGAIPVKALMEWKEARGNKAKQSALLDSFEKKLIGGSEFVNMSDYLDSIDPAKNKKNVEESESDSDDDAVHNDYLGGDVLQAGMGQSALPEADYGEWSD